LDIKCDRKTVLTHGQKICYMTNNLFLKSTMNIILRNEIKQIYHWTVICFL